MTTTPDRRSTHAPGDGSEPGAVGGSGRRAVPEIQPDRAWIGAPPGATVTNPTVWLLIACVLAVTATSVSYLSGALSALATVAINAVAIYVVFTVLHESMHGVAHPSRRLNTALGRLAGLMLTVSLPLFRGVHYEHHSHTNDPERDPDLVVARRPGWALPLWCLAVDVEYRRHFYGRRLWRNRRELAEAIAMDVLLVGVLAGGAATGTLGTFLVVWIGPALLAVLALAFLFDFLPHYPYDSRVRYFDTRIYPGRLLNVLLLGQNYHLIHHLWTTIPWYRYQGAFATIRDELERRGARIGWQVDSLPDMARDTTSWSLFASH